MPATPLVQFPWPLVIAGALGAAVAPALVAGVRRRGRRSAGRAGRPVLLASAVAGASAGAYAALVWLWAGTNRVACLYRCDEGLQFLSNEQFNQSMVMTDLAWILPAVALASGALAVWAAFRGRGRRR